MTGREESNRQYELRTKKEIEKMPKVIQDYSYSLSNFTPCSKFIYIVHIKTFVDFLNKECYISGDDYNDFKSIKKMDIDKYMEYSRINPKTGKEYSVNTRNARLAAVTNLFDFLLDNDIIDKNPCYKVDKVKGNKEQNVTYLTKEEVEDIKVKILTTDRSSEHEDLWKYRDYAIFILAFSTGMRKSAIRGINIDDLDLKKKEVKVIEKRNETKIVYLSTQTCDAIKKWIKIREQILDGKEVDALFISNRKQRISVKPFDDIIHKYTKDLGKNITPHKLRSTCAMNLYEATGDIYLVAQQLGHKNIRNTQIYAKATAQKMKDTAELMDKIYE